MNTLQAMHTVQEHYNYLRIAGLPSDAYAASTLLLSTNCWFTKWRIRCKRIITIYELLAYQVTHTLQAHYCCLRIAGLPSKEYATNTVLLSADCWLTKQCIRYKHTITIYKLLTYQVTHTLQAPCYLRVVGLPSGAVSDMFCGWTWANTGGLSFSSCKSNVMFNCM